MLKIINPKRANQNKSSSFVVYRNVSDASSTNIVDPDETAHAGAGSTLFVYILMITENWHFCWRFKGSIICFVPVLRCYLAR